MSTRQLGAETPAIFMDPRNPYAAHLLQDYAARLETVGLPKLAEEARKHAADVFAWQQQHGIETLTDPEPLKKVDPRAR